MATPMVSDASTFALWNFNAPDATSVGAAIDGNTFAMYRCDEAASTDPMVDAVGSYDLAQQGSPVARLTLGRIGGAREVTSLNQGFSRAASGADGITMAGNASIEAWIFWTGGSGVTGFFFPWSIGTIGGTPTDHLLFYVDIIATDDITTPAAIRSYWHSGANATSPQSYTSPSNTIPVNKWTHIAVTHEVSGSNRIVRIYVNKILIGTSSPLPGPSLTYGGVGGSLKMCAHRNTLPASYASKGLLDDLRVSTVTRSPSEIATTYDNGFKGCELDASGNGRDLIICGTAASVTPMVGTGARHIYNLSGGGRFRLDTSAALVSFLNPGGLPKFTYEALVKVNGVGGGGPISAISTSDSQLWGGMMAAYKDIIAFGGAGGTSGFSDWRPACVLTVDAWHYLAIVGDSPTGAASNDFSHNYYFYIDGVLVGVTPQAVGGSSTPSAAANSDLVVGDYWTFPSFSVFANTGQGMDFNQLRLSTKARTPKEILDQAVAYGFMGGGGTAMTLVSTVATANTITLTFSSAPVVLDVAALDRTRWSAATGSQSLIINTVSVVGNTVVLSTTAQANGSTYTLNMPNTTISSTGGAVYTGPFVQTFTGAGTVPVILITRVVDTRTLEITYDQAANKYDALNENNYTIDNGLKVTTVSMISTAIYRLTTTKQVDGTTYTLTATGIRAG